MDQGSFCKKLCEAGNNVNVTCDILIGWNFTEGCAWIRIFCVLPPTSAAKYPCPELVIPLLGISSMRSKHVAEIFDISDQSIYTTLYTGALSLKRHVLSLSSCVPSAELNVIRRSANLGADNVTTFSAVCFVLLNWPAFCISIRAAELFGVEIIWTPLNWSAPS